MDPNGKTASGNTLASYFGDMASVSVPTPEEEMRAFADMAVVEGKIVQLLLTVHANEASLRAYSVREGTPLPRQLYVRSGLKDEVVRFVRLTDLGRQWFQESVPNPGDKARIRALSSKKEALKNRFVAANLRLTVSIAKKYAKFCHHQSMGDLIQEGNIGLMKAVDRFDPDRGFRFATYAMWWIRHHVKRAVSDKEAPVRIPVHVSDMASKLSRLDGLHLAETGESMSATEMARQAKSTLERVQSVLSNRPRSTVWLDAPIGSDEDGVTHVDNLVSKSFPSPLEAICSEEVRDELLSLLSGLAPFESRIIRHRFGMDEPDQLTLQEVADRYDLSRERIRQVEAKALKKLRSRMSGHSLTEYLAETG